MIVQPKVRGFICTTAHPKGLLKAVDEDIAFVKEKGKIDAGKNVLVIGASMGYGLSARIAAAFGGGASTLGVIFDRPAAGIRTASAGWYNTAAFHQRAHEAGLYAKTVNGDAFSEEVKDKVVEILKRDNMTLDCVVYSVAAPRRTLKDGTQVSSVLKTTDKPYTEKTIDLRTREITTATIEPATDTEVENTIKVMGGEDWQEWILRLKKEGLLKSDAVTVAFSYIGPSLTHAIYKDGSIGQAKKDLNAKAEAMRRLGLRAFVSVNKALVTQSSSAIPVVPLYISLLYKVMKRRNTHETTIGQMQRLFGSKRLLKGAVTDENEFIRLDDLEMDEPTQTEIAKLWKQVGETPLEEIADLKGYDDEFLRLFGFGLDGVDYGEDVPTEIGIDGLES